jgi:ABC-2 type transport system permease protein
MTLYFLLMFISDMIFPLDMLPEGLRNVIPYLPAYPVVQLVRSAMLESVLNPQWMTYLALLVVYGVIATLIASRLFRWEPKA